MVNTTITGSVREKFTKVYKQPLLLSLINQWETTKEKISTSTEQSSATCVPKIFLINSPQVNSKCLMKPKPQTT